MWMSSRRSIRSLRSTRGRWREGRGRNGNGNGKGKEKERMEEGKRRKKEKKRKEKKRKEKKRKRKKEWKTKEKKRKKKETVPMAANRTGRADLEPGSHMAGRNVRAHSPATDVDESTDGSRWRSHPCDGNGDEAEGASGVTARDHLLAVERATASTTTSTTTTTTSSSSSSSSSSTTAAAAAAAAARRPHASARLGRCFSGGSTCRSQRRCLSQELGLGGLQTVGRCWRHERGGGSDPGDSTMRPGLAGELRSIARADRAVRGDL